MHSLRVQQALWHVCGPWLGDVRAGRLQNHLVSDAVRRETKFVAHGDTQRRLCVRILLPTPPPIGERQEAHSLDSARHHCRRSFDGGAELCFTENAALFGYTIKHCIPNLSGNSWIVMVSFVFLSILNIYFVPEAVYATCTLLIGVIVFKLQSLRANGNNLSIIDSIRPATRPEQKERSAAITIVFLLLSDSRL